MSIKVMTAVWEHSRASSTDLLILLALADNANDQGEAWPSIGYIAQKCRIDERTAQRRIRHLEAINEVVVVRAAGMDTPQGKTNRYIVTLSTEGGQSATPTGGSSAGGGVARTGVEGVAQVPPKPSVEPSINQRAVARGSVIAVGDIPVPEDLGERVAEIRARLRAPSGDATEHERNR